VGLHPHIGLSTSTYLLEGRIRHRDSLGVDQIIEPGDVNWMTAGSGISHMETSPLDEVSQKRRVHGLQFWVALPDEAEDCAPEFTHYNKKSIPQVSTDVSVIDVIVGKWMGLVSPVQTQSETLFVNYSLKQSANSDFKSETNELAVYILEGQLNINGTSYNASNTVIFSENSHIHIQALTDCRFVVFGGKAFAEEKYIWWNFVSSSQEKIQQAKINWNAGNFPLIAGINDRLMAPEK
jgi:redox-sensitive bicupin YhaK (pirin superfamily)